MANEPNFYNYTISTCQQEQNFILTNFPLYVPVSNSPLSIGNFVSVNQNGNCYTIVTDEGSVYLSQVEIDVIVRESWGYTFKALHEDCNGCFQANQPEITEAFSRGVNIFEPKDNRGSKVGGDDIPNYLVPNTVGTGFTINYNI